MGEALQLTVIVLPAVAVAVRFKGAAGRQEDGTWKPLVGFRPLGPPLIASTPRPKAAKARHMRQTSSPPCRVAAAATMPFRTSVKAGLQMVAFRPSLMYSPPRWFPAFPVAL